MKNEFEDYLSSIGISTTMLDTIRNKYKDLATAADVEDFDEIFISEGISSELIREYFSLWCFTNKLLCEATISDKKIGIYRLSDNISNLFINEYNFDLITPSENSKLSLSIRRIDATVGIVLNSSGINCSKLLDVSKKYFVSNLNY